MAFRRPGDRRQSRLPPVPSVQTSLPGDHRVLEPPDPIPNSAVKRYIADGSVEFLHARVGHRQALIENPVAQTQRGFFMPGAW